LTKYKQKIGITGCKGVLGSAFVKKYKTKFKISTYNGDVTNFQELSYWFNKSDMNYLIHFAAKVPTLSVEKNKKKAKKINVTSVRYLLKLISQNKKIKWFFFPSTSHVYKKSKLPLNEKSMINPSNYYAKTKFLAEKLIQNFKKKDKRPICIGRIFSYTNFDQNLSFVVPSLFYKIRNKKKLDIKLLKSERDFVHIDDICNAIYLLLIKKKNGVYNISSGRKIKIYELANLISKFIFSKKIFLNMGNISNSDILYGNNKKLKNIGWFPKKNIKKIVKDFVLLKKNK